MKKILALLIALMMLALPMASAETVFTFADPVLKLNMGEEQTIDLTGLELVLAAGELDNDSIGLKLSINGEEPLFCLKAMVIDNQLILTADGLSNTYFVVLPERVQNIQNFELPENIDLEAVIDTVVNGIEMDGDTIRVPYNVINDALSQLEPALKDVEIPGVDMNDFADNVNKLIESNSESNSGITLEGTYNETDGGMDVAAKAFLVQNGEASADPAFNLTLSLGENISLTIDVADVGSFSFSVVGDQVTIAASANGQSFSLTGKVGTREEDVAVENLDAVNALDLQNLTDEEQEQLGSELMNAAGGLITYFSGAMGDAA